MLKDILISMIIWVVVGCGNGSGVKRLDTRAVEKDTVLKWSQLVGESRLVRLETKEEALLNDYFRVWAGEKYIITYGNEEMYQFAADGTYIRKLASYGRAPGEYQNIIALTVDEPGERLYFSDYGRQNSIQVINLKNGEYENSLPGIYGFPKKMILAGDSVLYCIPLLLKDAAYEIYALTSSGQFLGGIKKETCREERQKNHSYLGIAGGFVHYMSGITDTLYRITADTRKPEYYFHAGHYLKEFKPDEKGEEILLRLTNDKEWLVRADACDSLGISESVTTYNILKKIAKKDTSGYVRGYAIISLGDIAVKIHKENELIKFLEEMLMHEKTEFTKINIYTVLYNLGQKEYFDKLLSMTNSKKYSNKCAVVNSLKDIANESNRDMIINILLEYKEKETARSVIYTIDDAIKKIEEMDDDEEESDE